MNSLEVRQKFIDYFQSKQHIFKSSSPIVIKDDPTLLFVNAGMNQFKEFFLGNKIIRESKLVNSQKCLRVSGKHNDLEEVGYDTYHHTMFEMLGNWSLGDYFKKEAIHLAWEFLIKELKISEERLYATYFKGDDKDGLQKDVETQSIWKGILDKDKVIAGVKKDNFWEMGKIGPCGPSTEIHIDLRSNDERKKVNTKDLINKDHPQVIEIWNIVFIEFNRKENETLELLPKKHVDTGMGFERLCMVLQDKKSTYDTDIFKGLIENLSTISKVHYGDSEKTDIAIRVIVDHIRAIAFCVADGQLPSNTGAGYVIRRILRRAVRYGYTHLNLKTPFLYKLIAPLSAHFKTVFSEISEQKVLIESVVEKEESMFLKTLGTGLELINNSISMLGSNTKEMSGKSVFELYDTYGFPPDLTALILKEKSLSYNQLEFDKEMDKQKKRSRSASEIIVGDWIRINDLPITGFVGYDHITDTGKIIKYRKVKTKDGNKFQIVFEKTPFYPEGGGQIGDRGVILPPKGSTLDKIIVLDTKKENNEIIHIVSNLPAIPKELNCVEYTLIPDIDRRNLTTRNHSATHLLHHQLRKMLGDHVEQRGSYVGSDYLRFDFSHFEKVTKHQVLDLERIINTFIAKGIELKEFRNLSMKEGKNMGALALFGEKYGESVRVVKFADSVELCGGTHVNNTSEIGLIKIISESSIASGIRRIEAVTSQNAFKFLNKQLSVLDQLKSLFKNPNNILDAINDLINENKELNILASDAKKNNLKMLIKKLDGDILEFNNFKVLFSELNINVAAMKDICFSFIEKYDNVFLALSTKKEDKIIINIALSKSLCETKGLDACEIIHQFGRHVNGRGGGQPFFAVASGDKPEGINNLFNSIKELLKTL